MIGNRLEEVLRSSVVSVSRKEARCMYWFRVARKYGFVRWKEAVVERGPGAKERVGDRIHITHAQPSHGLS